MKTPVELNMSMPFLQSGTLTQKFVVVPALNEEAVHKRGVARQGTCGEFE